MYGCGKYRDYLPQKCGEWQKYSPQITLSIHLLIVKSCRNIGGNGLQLPEGRDFYHKT
jgi:hypothetical protein